MKDNHRGSHLVSAVPQEESGTSSKPAGYCVVQNPTDVGVDEDSQCRLKPGNEMSHYQSPCGAEVKKGLQEVSNH